MKKKEIVKKILPKNINSNFKRSKRSKIRLVPPALPRGFVIICYSYFREKYKRTQNLKKRKKPKKTCRQKFITKGAIFSTIGWPASTPWSLYCNLYSIHIIEQKLIYNSMEKRKLQKLYHKKCKQ